MSAPARLLLLEDERNVAETLIERLRAAGFVVTRADSLASARRAIAEGSFALAILDVGLPDGSGFDLARQLRARAPTTAILFLTAHADAEDRIRGLEIGADDYVAKPFHFRELLLRIQNCLKRAQDLAQVPGEMRGLVHIGRARVDFERFIATVDGETQSLTHKECAVGGRIPDLAHRGQFHRQAAQAGGIRRIRPARDPQHPRRRLSAHGDTP